jgi:hypothetical protein
VQRRLSGALLQTLHSALQYRCPEQEGRFLLRIFKDFSLLYRPKQIRFFPLSSQGKVSVANAYLTLKEGTLNLHAADLLNAQTSMTRIKRYENWPLKQPKSLCTAPFHLDESNN